MSCKNLQRQIASDHCYTRLANSDLVPTSAINECNKPSEISTISNLFNTTTQLRTIASIVQEAHNDSIKSDGKPKVTTQEIVLVDKRLDTNTKYGYYTKQWKMFCSNFNLNDVSPTAENIV